MRAKGLWAESVIVRSALCALLVLLAIGTATAASNINTSGLVDGNQGLYVNGTTRIASTGVGTFASGTTVNSQSLCLADGTSCPANAKSPTTGWRNDSGSGNISLANTAVNISANTLFIDNTNGRVGIGTSSPAGKFEITNTNTTTAVRITLNSNTTANFLADAPALELLNTNVSQNHSLSNNNYARIDFSTTNTSGSIVLMASMLGIFTNHTNSTTSYNGQLAFFTSGTGTNAERLRIDQSGNIGIGTTGPSAKLDVNATNTTTLLRLTTSSFTTNLTSDPATLELLNTNVSTNQSATNNNYVRIDFSTINTSNAKFAMAAIVGIFKNHSNATTNYNGQLALFTTQAGASLERLRVDEYGSIGINTTTPSNTLQVVGGITATNITVVSPALSGTAQSLSIGGNAVTATSATSATSATTATTANNLAAGTYSYGSGSVQVNANGSNLLSGQNSNYYLNITGFNAANITGGTLPVARGGTGVTTSTGSGNTVLSASPTFTGTIIASTMNATASVIGDKLRAGNGGPGNATGTGSIYATTDIEYDGNLYGPGADLAELINASEPLTGGDVVEADTTRPETVRRSRTAYNTRVIGVISTEPSMIISKDTGGVPLALAGRVPIKVTAENGPIHPGDLLTTSSRYGYAMKCDDPRKCQGAIVAKALGTWESGRGNITGVVLLG